jgi:flagellar L-ring protein precursor FlgH
MKSAPILFVLALLAGCGPNHVQPFTPRERVYKPGSYAPRQPHPGDNPGSLFSDAGGGYLEDTRAVGIGDLIIVRIEESADAQGGATTKLDRESTGSGGVSAMLGIMPKLKAAYPGMSPDKLWEFASKAGFAGSGDTRRNGTLSGQMAVRVVRQLPNGDLFLEGTKVVLINNEEYHLYVSGITRPADIASDSSIASSRLADAQIEFTGRGDIASQQRKGWGARLVDAVNPF